MDERAKSKDPERVRKTGGLCQPRGATHQQIGQLACGIVGRHPDPAPGTLHERGREDGAHRNDTLKHSGCSCEQHLVKEAAGGGEGTLDPD